MRSSLMVCFVLSTLGCGARTGLVEPSLLAEIDGGGDGASGSSGNRDASLGDSSQDARDATAPFDVRFDQADHVDSPLDVKQDRELLPCALLQISPFIQLGTGPGGSSVFPAPRWVGDGWSVTWLEGNEESGASPATYFARVRNTQVDVPPKEIIPDNHTGPGPAWNGSELVLCWDTGPSTMLARLASNGDRVVPDDFLHVTSGLQCGLRRSGDRLLATLADAGDGGGFLYYAWLSLQGVVLEGPSLVAGPMKDYYTSSTAVLDDNILFLLGAEPDGPTVLNLRTLDNHFQATRPDRQLASELIRPLRPVMRRVGDSIALVVVSDEDEAPANGWSVWMQSLDLEGNPAGVLRHITNTRKWERPALIDVGDRLLLGTIDPDTQSPILTTYTASGELVGQLHLTEPLPKGPCGDLTFATGPYWGELGVAFSAYAGQPRTEVFFTTLACGE